MIEFNMSKKFQDYCIKNVLGRIEVHKMITELLKNEGMSKPKDLRVKSCCIADLKYNGHNITGAKMNIAAGKIFLEV